MGLAKAWLYAEDEARRRALAAELGRLALEEVAFVPLGQYLIRTAFRANITHDGLTMAPIAPGIRGMSVQRGSRPVPLADVPVLLADVPGRGCCYCGCATSRLEVRRPWVSHGARASARGC